MIHWLRHQTRKIIVVDVKLSLGWSLKIKTSLSEKNAFIGTIRMPCGFNQNGPLYLYIQRKIQGQSSFGFRMGSKFADNHEWVQQRLYESHEINSAEHLAEFSGSKSRTFWVKWVWEMALNYSLISAVSHSRLGWPLNTNKKGSKSLKMSAV